MNCHACNRRVNKADTFCKDCGKLLAARLDNHITGTVKDAVTLAILSERKKIGTAITTGLLIVGLLGYRQVSDLQRSVDVQVAAHEQRFAQQLKTSETAAMRSIDMQFAELSATAQSRFAKVKELDHEISLATDRLRQINAAVVERSDKYSQTMSTHATSVPSYYSTVSPDILRLTYSENIGALGPCSFSVLGGSGTTGLIDICGKPRDGIVIPDITNLVSPPNLSTFGLELKYNPATGVLEAIPNTLGGSMPGLRGVSNPSVPARKQM